MTFGEEEVIDDIGRSGGGDDDDAMRQRNNNNNNNNNNNVVVDLHDSEYTADSTYTSSSSSSQHQHAGGNNNAYHNNNNHNNNYYDDDDSNNNNRHHGGSGGSGWFSGMGTDLRNIAHCLTDNVPPIVSGVTNLVHRIAHEIALLEKDGEGEGDGDGEVVEKDGSEVVGVSNNNNNNNNRYDRTSSYNNSNCEDGINEDDDDDDDGMNIYTQVVSAGTTSSSWDQKDDSTLVLPWEIRQESSPQSLLPSSPSPAVVVSRRGKKEVQQQQQPIHRMKNYSPPMIYPDDDSVPVCYVTDNELMRSILALSHHEGTFVGPFGPDGDAVMKNASGGITAMLKNSPAAAAVAATTTTTPSEDFVLNKPRLDLIRRLLDIDTNLSTMHKRLLPGGKGMGDDQANIIFWRNYFYHCEQTRSVHLERRRKKLVDTTTATSTTDPLVVVPTKKSSGDLWNPPSGHKDAKQPTDVVVIGKTLSDGSLLSSSPRPNIRDSMVSAMGEDDDDDGSLVPVESVIDGPDDSSYIIASAPNSLNTFATTRSVGDDIVMVNTTTAALGGRGGEH